MKKIAIFGCGGHAKVIADIIHATQLFTISAFFDNNINANTNGIPLFSDLEKFADFIKKTDVTCAAIAVGNNKVRKMFFQEAKNLGLSLPCLIHPSAIISPFVTIDEGTVVMPRAVINSTTRISRGVIINTGAIVEHDCHIEEFTHIAPGTVLCGGVSIGEQTLVGAGTTVIPLKKVGAFCIVGAGSTVVRDIPDNSCAYGNPARTQV